MRNRAWFKFCKLGTLPFYCKMDFIIQAVILIEGVSSGMTWHENGRKFNWNGMTIWSFNINGYIDLSKVLGPSYLP